MTQRREPAFVDHRAQRREHAEPTEQMRPIPLAAAVVTLAMVLVGAGYLLLSESFGRADLGDRRTLADLRPTTQQPGAGGAALDGKLLYTANCIACHQASGQGVPAVFPPLAGSEWVQGDARVLVNILLHGVNGDITVAGKAYQGAMPAFAQHSDAELAAIASYIRSAWSNRGQAVTPETVAGVRKTNARSAPFSGGAELDALARSLAQTPGKKE